MAITMLSDISQSQKYKYHVFSDMQHLIKNIQKAQELNGHFGAGLSFLAPIYAPVENWPYDYCLQNITISDKLSL